MRRFLAFIVDNMVSAIPVCLYGVVFLLNNEINYSSVLVWWWTTLLIEYLYFFMNDILLNGSSIGKKIMKVEVVLKEQNLLKFALVHTLLKMFCAGFNWVMAVVYFASGKHMPYDKLFYKKVS